MDVAEFRSAFPVLEHVTYLNAGTNGPIPSRALDPAAARLADELELGRAGHQYWEDINGLHEERRSMLAELLGCAAGEVALTHSTTDSVNAVLWGLDLRDGDEVVTSDEEHPGVLAPLGALRERHGVSVRTVPFDALAGAVGDRTRLVACSHVSWITGRVVDAPALSETGALVLLDGAQALGAVPVDVASLGCDFYAASGQKWLCGPNGTGCLYLRRERIEELAPAWPGFQTLEDPHDPLAYALHSDARRHDLAFSGGHTAAWALASLELLGEAGWEQLHERAAELASRLAAMLAERGHEVVPRGDSTLVSWRDPTAEDTVTRLATEGVIVRQLPGRGLVRASVGAWSSEEDLERLVGRL
jgi:selenocysteine lyase/cysteine desulfurase